MLCSAEHELPHAPRGADELAGCHRHSAAARLGATATLDTSLDTGRERGVQMLEHCAGDDVRSTKVKSGSGQGWGTLQQMSSGATRVGPPASRMCLRSTSRDRQQLGRFGGHHA